MTHTLTYTSSTSESHTVSTHTVSVTISSTAVTETQTTTATTLTTTFSTTASTTASFTSQTNTTTTQTTPTQTTSFTTTAITATSRAVILIKVPVEVVVNDADEYVKDPAVQGAYKAAFVEITGLNASMVDVEMVHDGNVTVTFLISVPATEEGLVAEVQQKITAVTPDVFADIVREKVDEAVGADKYTEQVVGEGRSKGGTTDLDAAGFGCFPSLAVFITLVALSLRAL